MKLTTTAFAIILIFTSTCAAAYDWNANDSYNNTEQYEIGQPMKTIDNARERRAASIQRERNRRMDSFLLQEQLDRAAESTSYEYDYSYDY